MTDDERFKGVVFRAMTDEAPGLPPAFWRGCLIGTVLSLTIGWPLVFAAWWAVRWLLQ